MGDKFDIKSPIFKPKPGWGGKSKIWLKSNFESMVLPLISAISLGVGIYLVFLN